MFHSSRREGRGRKTAFGTAGARLAADPLLAATAEKTGTRSTSLAITALSYRRLSHTYADREAKGARELDARGNLS